MTGPAALASATCFGNKSSSTATITGSTVSAPFAALICESSGASSTGPDSDSAAISADRDKSRYSRRAAAANPPPGRTSSGEANHIAFSVGSLCATAMLVSSNTLIRAHTCPSGGSADCGAVLERVSALFSALSVRTTSNST